MNKLIEAMVRQDTPSTEVAEPDMAFIKDALRQLKDRFIDERVKGWTHPPTGEAMPPVSQEEAEARWAAVEEKFRLVLLKGSSSVSDPTNKRLRIGKAMPASSDYSDTEGATGAGFEPPKTDWAEHERSWQRTPGQRAADDEPSLRRGESLAWRAVRKMIQA